MWELDRSVAALVLNFGKYPFHQGCLGVIRSLGRAGVPVFAVQPKRFIPSGASRYLSGKFYWKGEETNSGQFLEFMADLAAKLSRPAILVPTDDLSAVLIAENAEALGSTFRFPRPRATLPRSLANKRKLYELCRKLGIACPATQFPESREEFLDFARRARLPVVVKAIEPWSAPKALRSTVIVSERTDLVNYCDTRQVPPASVLIQEMIPSSASEDWFVHGYCDSRSNPLAMFTGVKLRSYPPSAGPTTLGRSVRNDFLRQQAADLTKAIGFWGIMDLDFKFDKRDGRYNLLDFNPRLGAQFRLFRTGAGVDVVRAMHLDLTGRAMEAAPQIEGRTFLSEVHDLPAGWACFRNGTLTLKEWFGSLRKIDETAWFSPDDPWPFLVLCLNLPVRAVKRGPLRWKSQAAVPLPNTHARQLEDRLL